MFGIGEFLTEAARKNAIAAGKDPDIAERDARGMARNLGRYGGLAKGGIFGFLVAGPVGAVLGAGCGYYAGDYAGRALVEPTRPEQEVNTPDVANRLEK